MTDASAQPEASFAAIIAGNYRKTHAQVVQIASDLSDEQLAWQPPGSVTSIRFNLWHLARWADHLQAAIPGMTPELRRRLGAGRQIWEAEGLAATWHFDTASLGYAETGMLMETEVAMRLPFPSKEVLLDYVQRTFAAADAMVSAVDDQQWLEVERDQGAAADRSALGARRTVGHAILTHLSHENRHLGMIECLRGLQGGSGTATQ